MNKIWDAITWIATIGAVVIILAVVVAVAGGGERSSFSWHGLLGVSLIILVVAAIASIYFLPTLVALVGKHHNAEAILVLNLFLGWTLVGWVVALVWAFTRPSSSPPKRTQTM